MADEIDVGINIHDDDGGEVAKAAAAGIRELRKELDLLVKQQNSAEAKAAAAAEVERLRQLADERRASAINIANTRRDQLAADRAARKQEADETAAAIINLRKLRMDAAAQERAARAEERAARAADRETERAAQRAETAREREQAQLKIAVRKQQRDFERRQAKQLDDERLASARNLTVLRNRARAEERAIAAQQKADAAQVKADLREKARLEREAVKAADAYAAAQRRASAAQERNKAGIIDAANATRRLIRELVALAAAYAGAQAIRSFIDMGLKFNETIENANLGVASLITSQTKMVDSTGQTVEGVERLRIAQALSVEQVNKLRVAGLRSVATTQQLVVAFQQAVGVGLRWGLTLDQIRVITVQVAQAAGALGVPLNQLNEEIRSLLTGTITPRNTRIATALGITNAQIKQAQQAGTLFEFVTKRMEAFSIAGEATAKTFRGVMSNIREAIENLAGDATKPLFDTLRVNGQKILEEMFNLNTARISDSFNGIKDLAQEIFASVADFISSAMESAVQGAKDFSVWLKDNQLQVRLLGSSIALAAGEMSSLVRDAVSLIVPLTEAGVQGGIFSNTLKGAGLIIADVHTLFDAILVALGGIGAGVLTVLTKPLTFVAKLLSYIVDIFSKDMGNSIRKAADEVDAWVGRLRHKVAERGRETLGEGNTATEQYMSRAEAAVKATEIEVAARQRLADSLDSANRIEESSTALLDDNLKKKLVSQKEYSRQAQVIQRLYVKRQIDAQFTYLQSLTAENEGDRLRTRLIIDELRKREAGLKRAVTLTPAAGKPEPKDSAVPRAAGDTALIKAELANRLKELKIELDNERLSYKDYYDQVVAAQQTAADKQIAVQRRLLEATTDLGSRDKILDQIKILEASKTAAAEKGAEDRRVAEEKLDSELTTAHVQLLKDQGRLSDARALEVQDKFKQLVARLKIEGNEAGVAIVTQLFDIDTAKVRVEEITRQSSKVFAELNSKIGEIKNEQKSGQLRGTDVTDALAAAYTKARDQLQLLLPDMREAARLTADPSQMAAVDALSNKIDELNDKIQQTTDDFYELKKAGLDTLQNGITDFLDQATEGAKSLKDVWISVAGSIVASLRRIASQMFATYLIQKLLGFVGGGVGGSVSGGGVQIAGDAAGAVVAASGGYIQGPGTGTSDSIPAWLSHGEFVVKADAVKNVGVDFLHTINQSTSSSIIPRRRAKGYAEGGLVSASEGAHRGGFDATVGLEPGLVVKHMESRQGELAIMNVVARNRKVINTVLGGRG